MTTDLIERAQALAAAKHDGQTYGAHDFIFHPGKVVETLAVFGWSRVEDAPLYAAAWLHDIVEDTPTKLSDLRGLFGDDVTNLVDAVTDSLEGKNRRERQLDTYRKLRAIATVNFDDRPWPLALKLADRIANFEASGVGINSKHFRMYQSEHPWFCRNMGMLYWNDPRIQKMWQKLDTLATIDPRRGVVRTVCNLIRDPGPHPEFHEKAMGNLSREWPSLWKALQDLLRVDPL